jgi:uncharacterized integral membrane protein (TIGR00697 family)
MTTSAAQGGYSARFLVVTLVFVVALLVSNIVAVKLVEIGGLVLPAAIIIFPVSYILGDVLTEVYGYARTRKVIWAGFISMIFATIMGLFVIHLPGDPEEPFNAVIQPALEIVFGSTWRIVVASIVAFWCGDFMNSYVMAKMKVWTEGRHLWTRTIGSTAVGQFVDSALFYPIAFLGTWQPGTMVKVIAFNWAFKVSVEIVFTPLTYAIVGWLKRRENEDWYDRHTDFTPFSLKD